jgi:hypothetical protein
MIYILFSLSLIILALGYFILRDLTKERDYWKAKHDELREELNMIHHANADATMQRITGQPVFGRKPEPQKPQDVLVFGSERAEREKAKLSQQIEPEALTDEDLEHLGKVQSGGVQ